MSSKAVHLFTDGLVLFSSIGLLLSVFFASTNLQENNYIITRLNESWKKSPITKVQSTYNDICVSTFTNQFSVNNYLWPGNSKGCNCINIPHNSFKAKKYRGNFYSGSCDRNQTLANCENIYETQTFPLHKWRNNYFCHRTLEEGYFGLITVRKGEHCPIYYKSCGKIDTLENELCMKSVEDCPINYLKIVDDNNSLRFEISTENTDGKLLTEFFVTDGDSVCLNSQENLFYENGYSLFTEKNTNKRKGCSSFVINTENNQKIFNDDRFSLIDSYPKRQFYDHNGLYVVHNLPRFLDLTSNHSIKLFSANYIGWNKNCMYIGEKSILEEFNQLNIYLNKIGINNCKIITISTILVLYIGLVIFLLKYKNTETVDHELTIPNNFLYKFMGIYIVFVVINFYIFILIHENKKLIYLNQSNTSFFDSLFSENCSDNITNISLKHFGKEFFENLRRYHYMSTFVVLNIVFSVFLTLFGYVVKKKPDNLIEMNFDTKKFL
jgi:hypothetical protein